MKEKKRTISPSIFRIETRERQGDYQSMKTALKRLSSVPHRSAIQQITLHPRTNLLPLLNDVRLSYSLTYMYTYTSQNSRMKQSIHNSSCTRTHTHIHPLMLSQLSIVILSENAQAVRLISIPHILILHHDDGKR